MMMPYGYGYGYGGFYMFLIGLFGLLVLAGIVLIVVWAVRGGHHEQGPMPGPSRLPGEDAALKAARERYARGELTKEEFEDIRRTLGY